MLMKEELGLGSFWAKQVLLSEALKELVTKELDWLVAAEVVLGDCW